MVASQVQVIFDENYIKMQLFFEKMTFSVEIFFFELFSKKLTWKEFSGEIAIFREKWSILSKSQFSIKKWRFLVIFGRNDPIDTDFDFRLYSDSKKNVGDQNVLEYVLFFSDF